MSMPILNRLQRLREELPKQEIDSVLISQPENRYYLSGFNGSSGYLLITQDRAILVTDFRYIEQAKRQAPEYEIFRMAGEVPNWFPELVTGLNVKILGFEGANITFTMFQQLRNALVEKIIQIKLVPVNGIVETLRAIKEPGEIDLIRRAIKIGDDTFNRIESIIQAGMTEREIAWEIEKSMREQGSQSLPYEIIVASGPNAAMPHAQPSDRRINLGEPVIIDMGARYEGYTSDLTRTICPGNPDETFKRVYDIVLTAQLAAIAIVKEGMTGDQADSLARTVIREAGYAEAFGHGTGHGVGLATHENPRLAPNSNDVLASGMAFTIEPGIYLPGWGGIRIEDMVLLEDGKAKVLSNARKT